MPELALDLAGQVLDYPRHLGIHSGGMVMADRPLVEFCPVEWARMEDRSVLQWDKDDCAAAGLVKFDLLGLGMLHMLHLAVDLIREHEGVDVDLATIPQEEDVYDLLCAADTVGVFQVESRAQMATLPRLRPRCFYDLVIEVALIRPGPIQGGSVHPYLRRRNGEEPVTYPHPILEGCLEKTLGVPLFQEQLMQIAIDAAGLLARRGRPAASGDGLEALEGAHGRDARAPARGDGRARHHRRHGRRDRHEARGVRALRLPREPLGELRLPRVLELVGEAPVPDRVRVRAAERAADGLLLAPHARARRRPARRGGARSVRQRVATSSARWSRGAPVRGPSGTRSRAGTPTRRRTRCASACATCAGWRTGCSTASTRPGRRRRGGEFRDLEDFTRRTGAPVDALESLATAGAFTCLGVERREALWAPAWRASPRRRSAARCRASSRAPSRPRSRAWTRSRRPRPTSGPPASRRTGTPRSSHASGSPRAAPSPSADLRELPHHAIVEVGGVVTHRQRPETASGVTFLNLEDETGLVNVICTPDVWRKLPQGRAHVTRGGRAWAARAPPGRDQPPRSPIRAARPLARVAAALPRLPLSPSLRLVRLPMESIPWCR